MIIALWPKFLYKWINIILSKLKRGFFTTSLANNEREGERERHRERE